MAPRVRVRKETKGPTKPGEVVDYPRGAGGPSDPVIVVDSGPSDPVRGIEQLSLGAKADVRFGHVVGPYVPGVPVDPGEPPARTYAQILIEDFGADGVWPLVDIESGTTILAYEDAAKNGTLVGWDLQNAVGPVPGTLAPFLDGVNDYGTLPVAQLSANPLSLSIVIWLKINALSGGTARRGWYWAADSNNRLAITKTATDAWLCFYIAGGTANTVSSSISDNAWHMLHLCVNSGQFFASLDGVQMGATKTGLGTWAGAFTSVILGAETTAPINPFDGLMAYAAYKTGVWTVSDAAAMYAAAATAESDTELAATYSGLLLAMG